MILFLCVCFFSGVIQQTQSAFESKIVGGHNVSIADFPHSAFLAVNCDMGKDVNESSSSWMCGSSILTQKLLLTAAHCLHACSPFSKVGVAVGHEDILKGYKILVYSFLVHEEYGLKSVENDIALVRLNKTLKFGATINRVALMRHPPYQEKAQVAGWGLTNETTMTQLPYLKSINQYVWKKWDCILKIVGDHMKGTICASGDSKEDYASGGDSGSALVVRGYIQIGLVSFKYISIDTSVVVYTDTGYFFKWIKKGIEIILCD